MSVGRMKKFFLIAHSDCQESIVGRLRKMGITEIEFGSDAGQSEPLSDIEAKLAKVNAVAETLARYGRTASGKVVLSGSEVDGIVSGMRMDEVHGKCSGLTGKISALEARINRNRDTAAKMAPWRELPYRIDELSGTENIYIVAASMKQNSAEELEAGSDGQLYDIAWSRASGGETYFILAADRSVSDRVDAMLKEADAQIFDLAGSAGGELPGMKPSEIMRQMEKAMDEARAEIGKLSGEIRNMDVDLDRLMVLADHYRERYAVASAQERAEKTGRTFILEGWVPEREEEGLRKSICEISEAVEITTRHPQGDEVPPTVLQNRPVVSPFEFVTGLYSQPDYREFDPTPLFTPFFAVFFALCMSDMVYGMMLTALAYAGLARISRDNKLFRVLMYCGIMTVIAGLLTDSFAGFKISALIPAVRKIVIVDIIKEPTKMLFISFALGLVQVLFGMTVKVAQALRDRRFMDAAGQVIWIGFFLSVVPLAYKLMFGNELVTGITAVVSKTALVFAAGVVLTGGSGAKKIFLRPLLGLTKLYNVVGNCADILSYSRILALGLAGAAIAQTVNTIVKMVFGMGTAGYIFGVLIFIGGHVFNLVVNSLGSFVHSARLQYLEFFSKFFTGNGRAFNPFREERKYSEVRN